MTPKNKAKELVDKYLCIDEIYNVDLFCDECGMSNDAAKYCALIAVDELIIEKNKWENGSFYTSKYWDYVKQEIEKL
jgi:hypothetical protein